MTAYYSVEKICQDCNNQIPITWYSHLCQNCNGKLSLCAICRSTIVSRKDLILCPECETSYHKDHLNIWHRSKNTCPSCRNFINDYIMGFWSIEEFNYAKLNGFPDAEKFELEQMKIKTKSPDHKSTLKVLEFGYPDYEKYLEGTKLGYISYKTYSEGLKLGVKDFNEYLEFIEMKKLKFLNLDQYRNAKTRGYNLYF